MAKDLVEGRKGKKVPIMASPAMKSGKSMKSKRPMRGKR